MCPVSHLTENFEPTNTERKALEAGGWPPWAPQAFLSEFENLNAWRGHFCLLWLFFFFLIFLHFRQHRGVIDIYWRHSVRAQPLLLYPPLSLLPHRPRGSKCRPRRRMTLKPSVSLAFPLSICPSSHPSICPPSQHSLSICP